MATTAASLLNTPQNEQDFDQWAFSLNANILEIQQALEAQTGQKQPQYQIYPVPQPAMSEWLQRVSQALDEICALTGVPSFDVENIDLQDERERQRWANSIFFEVQQARQVLRI